MYVKANTLVKKLILCCTCFCILESFIIYNECEHMRQISIIKSDT